MDQRSVVVFVLLWYILISHRTQLFLFLTVCLSLFLSLFPPVSDSRVPEAAEAGDTCQHRDSVSSLSASLPLLSFSILPLPPAQWIISTVVLCHLGTHSHTNTHTLTAFNSIGLVCKDSPTSAEAAVM